MNGQLDHVDEMLSQLRALATNKQNPNRPLLWNELGLIINSIDTIKDVLRAQQIEIENLKKK
ncbi:MAG TPA: hypothetical protein VMG59_12160 [Phycisphaerae bacterium]|nr:hypothetical protein [Phycisphaerae bacterium]